METRFCPNSCPSRFEALAPQSNQALNREGKVWSEWQDLNLRPPRPERGALPPAH